jgi:drug/metabolite transporter (DMT)-like permease
MSVQPKSLISLAPVVFVVLWATGFVVARLSAGHVEPVSFLAYRFPIAGVLLLVIALINGAAWPKGKDIVHASAAGALIHAGYLAPIYWAVAHGMPAGVSALIVGLQPLITAFLAAPILAETITRKHWLGLFTGLFGVGLVLAPKFSMAMLGGITPVTVLACLFGTFAVSFGTVYQKKYAAHLPLLTSMVWQYFGASVVVTAIAAVFENFGFDGTTQAWLALGWAVFVISLGAIVLLMVMIREGAVSRVSSLIFLVPAVSAFTTFLVFDEKLTLLQICGMAVCAGAVLIVSRSAQRPA